jgi:hypothetical protein
MEGSRCHNCSGDKSRVIDPRLGREPEREKPVMYTIFVCACALCVCVCVNVCVCMVSRASIYLCLCNVRVCSFMSMYVSTCLCA